CPSAPEDASTKFVNQCGVIVRARIPITTRLWKMTKPEEQQHAVPAHPKEMLWAELKDMFTLSEGVDQELVKKCALRKMALAFATFKKKLYTNYIKKVLSTETHRRATTGNTKSREVTRALEA